MKLKFGDRAPRKNQFKLGPTFPESKAAHQYPKNPKYAHVSSKLSADCLGLPDGARGHVSLSSRAVANRKQEMFWRIDAPTLLKLLEKQLELNEESIYNILVAGGATKNYLLGPEGESSVNQAELFDLESGRMSREFLPLVEVRRRSRSPGRCAKEKAERGLDGFGDMVPLVPTSPGKRSPQSARRRNSAEYKIGTVAARGKMAAAGNLYARTRMNSLDCAPPAEALPGPYQIIVERQEKRMTEQRMAQMGRGGIGGKIGEYGWHEATNPATAMRSVSKNHHSEGKVRNAKQILQDKIRSSKEKCADFILSSPHGLPIIPAGRAERKEGGIPGGRSALDKQAMLMLLNKPEEMLGEECIYSHGPGGGKPTGSCTKRLPRNRGGSIPATRGGGIPPCDDALLIHSPRGESTNYAPAMGSRAKDRRHATFFTEEEVQTIIQSLAYNGKFIDPAKGRTAEKSLDRIHIEDMATLGEPDSAREAEILTARRENEQERQKREGNPTLEDLEAKRAVAKKERHMRKKREKELKRAMKIKEKDERKRKLAGIMGGITEESHSARKQAASYFQVEQKMKKLTEAEKETLKDIRRQQKREEIMARLASKGVECRDPVYEDIRKDQLPSIFAHKNPASKLASSLAVSRPPQIRHAAHDPEEPFDNIVYSQKIVCLDTRAIQQFLEGPRIKHSHSLPALMVFRQSYPNWLLGLRRLQGRGQKSRSQLGLLVVISENDRVGAKISTLMCEQGFQNVALLNGGIQHFTEEAPKFFVEGFQRVSGVVEMGYHGVGMHDPGEYSAKEIAELENHPYREYF